MTRSADTFLNAVRQIITSREQTAGKASDTLRLTATFWSAWLSRRLGHKIVLRPADVALLMILLKLARASGGNSDDHLFDIAGYSLLAWQKED